MISQRLADEYRQERSRCDEKECWERHHARGLILGSTLSTPWHDGAPRKAPNKFPRDRHMTTVQRVSLTLHHQKQT